MHLADSSPEPSCRIGTSAKAWSSGVDRVAQAALLADLLEQPRAHRAAEQRRVDRQRRPLADVGDARPRGGRSCAGATGWCRARSTSVCGANVGRRLVGLGRGQRGEAPEAAPAARSSAGRCSRLPTRNAPPRGARPAALAEGHDPLAGEAAQVLLRARAPCARAGARRRPPGRSGTPPPSRAGRRRG